MDCDHNELFSSSTRTVTPNIDRLAASTITKGADVSTSQIISELSQLPPIRTVLLASADAGLRTRLRTSLLGLRWQVLEASGGAEASAQLERTPAEALLVDSWLPD